MDTFWRVPHTHDRSEKHLWPFPTLLELHNIFSMPPLFLSSLVQFRWRHFHDMCNAFLYYADLPRPRLLLLSSEQHYLTIYHPTDVVTFPFFFLVYSIKTPFLTWHVALHIFTFTNGQGKNVNHDGPWTCHFYFFPLSSILYLFCNIIFFWVILTLRCGFLGIDIFHREIQAWDDKSINSMHAWASKILTLFKIVDLVFCLLIFHVHSRWIS